ncbi:hypothetical protein RB195_010812 [Necator americanus]|uniref:Uncharacterized protein n=1 Tax=Necator americanus TaxID=51031 RepID=A0ABR1D0D6_NECAM
MRSARETAEHDLQDLAGSDNIQNGDRGTVLTSNSIKASISLQNLECYEAKKRVRSENSGTSQRGLFMIRSFTRRSSFNLSSYGVYRPHFVIETVVHLVSTTSMLGIE